MSLWRLGSVPYLNAKPLIWGLDRDPAVQLTLKPPSELVRVMSRLDAALLPSIEVLRLGLNHVQEIGIASEGRTDSVLLHLKVPLKRIRTVALDLNSRTTNTLARILLEKRYGLQPRYLTHNPDGEEDFREDPGIDAAITIGDASFRDWGTTSLDLGSAWRDFTGMPFVFALWAVRKQDASLERRLRGAAREGRKRIEEIARHEHARVNLTLDECLLYLKERISYDLGPAERSGLLLFERHARALGLLDSAPARR